jgi:hypothetical protein
MLKPVALPDRNEAAASAPSTDGTVVAAPTAIILRSLPWVCDWHNGRSRWGLYAWVAGWSATLTGLALIPLAAGVWTVPRAVRTRSRKLTLLTCSWFGLAVLLIAIKFDGMALLVTFKWVLPIALSLVTFALYMCRSIWRQQWSRVGGLLVLVLAFSAIVGPLWYWHDSHRLEDWERYTWDEWYVIGLLGIWLSGVALLLSAAAQHIRRWTRGTSSDGKSR